MKFARVWALFLLIAGIVHAEVAVPPYSAPVVDLTGTLSGAAQSRIETKIANLEATKGSQIAILIVPTTQPEEIEQYSIRVADAWKSGRKKVDDGVILLIAKEDRRVRIEVGRGLEGAIPDITANRIVEETIEPHFKAGDFDGGVEAAVDRLIGLINGEPLPTPDKRWQHGANNFGHLLPILLVGIFAASNILRAIFGRLLGAFAVGALGGMIAWILTHLLPIGFGAGVLAFLFALLSGGAGRGWTSGGGWGGYGGGFGGGGGGGGFGGGGGGSFGGGGASGRW